MKSVINELKPFVWVNEGVLSQNQIEDLRVKEIDLTNFSYFIDKDNEQDIFDAIQTIKEHHPSQTIWTEL